MKKNKEKTADSGFNNVLILGQSGHGETDDSAQPGFTITKCAECSGRVCLKGKDRWRIKNDRNFKPLCKNCDKEREQLG